MTTALYRRYRPETFAEVVGQDHVTAPLRQALRSGQTNHAYLFSGPRGCGKTTSARILARCLNCAQGPTDTPCGVCESCVELARGGPGSLDVVEIDAASHGGVDDARDLRERATFAPARDRYKVFILDEAHMVSPQGFNALLKIVEEPPEHVKFIFATTEPDKVIGTIRSRTHHYPFRLVPPDVMVGYLDQLCTAEGVRVGSGVLPLVVRAGGGSVRDSLSVLDQLIAGSGPDGLGYEDAVALLGYTHASLLDDLVEAVAARDGASAFRVVERVISTGHEPRRFVEDLLERLRDLIVLAASGDAAAAVLRDVPGDQMARMQTQARQLGAAELSRSADLVNAALSEMTGATSPRLHLELLMARLLLPALDDTAAGIGARVDRLEREGVRVAPGGAPGAASLTSGAPAAPAASAAAARPVPDAPAPAPAVEVERVAVVTPAPEPIPAPAPADRTAEAVESGATGRHAPDDAPGGATDEAVPAAPGGDTDEAGAAAPEPHDERVVDPAPATPVQEAVPHDVPVAEPVAPAERPAGAPGGGDTEMLRRRWPEVLDTLGRLKKTTWVLISQNAQVVELNATTLTLGFGAPGLASAFRGGSHADLVQQAVRETLGFAVKVEGVLAGDGAAPARGPASGPAPTSPSRGSGAPSAAEAAASWD
ncbi:DNA polymerase III subunit gamma and tau, partial [Cellulomonas triticagri]